MFIPKRILFEGSATCDPIPVEAYSHSLKKTIEFFGKSKKGRFRSVTKYADVDTLLHARHNGHTEIRFTLNTNKVINDYEKGTASLQKRIEACQKIITAGYPLGFIIAPIFLYNNWKEDYRNLSFFRILGCTKSKRNMVLAKNASNLSPAACPKVSLISFRLFKSITHVVKICLVCFLPAIHLFDLKLPP